MFWGSAFHGNGEGEWAEVSSGHSSSFEDEGPNIKAYLKAGYRIAVELDLEKFFDTLQHDVLFAKRGQRALGPCGAKGTR
jgi:hypothetical protein